MTLQETYKIIKDLSPNIGKYYSNSKDEKHLFHIVSSVEQNNNKYVVKITMINEYGNLMWIGSHECFFTEYRTCK